MTKEDFNEWKNNSFTKKIYALMESVKDEFKDDIANGTTLKGSNAGTCESTALLVGTIYGIDQFLEMEVI